MDGNRTPSIEHHEYLGLSDSATEGGANFGATAVTWSELRLLIVRSNELSEHAKVELIRCGDRVCSEDQDGAI